MPFRKYSYELYLMIAVNLLFSSSLASSSKVESQKEPFVIVANTLHHNNNTNVIHAEGKVYVSHDHQLLYADRVEYHKETDTLYAQGNVWIRDKEGNFSFSDSAELRNKFNDGFLKNLKILLVDNSRAVALEAKRFGGQKVVLWNGVYSPCQVCRKEPDVPPIWQLRASKIIHSRQEKEILYHHAFMDFWGIPVFYTPYFFHADPSVKRKTGLLSPVYGSGSDLGFILIQPYFWDLGPHKDLTLYPVYTSKGEPIIGAEYRHLFSSATFRINTSYAGNSHTLDAQKNNPNNYKIPGKNRWHVFMDARYELSPTLLMTLKIRRASDLTYLRRYPVTIENTTSVELQRTLTSTLALERFTRTSYGEVRGYVFQADTPQTSPLIYPTMNYSYETIPGKFGETYGVNVNFLNLSRQEGIPGQGSKKMTRGSLEVQGQIPYVSSWGDIWQMKVKLRGDGYLISGYQPEVSSQPQNHVHQRLFPQGALNWRYPLLKFLDKSQWILEPSAMIVTASQRGNSVNIPEDTPYMTLDSTNLYLMNRFNGIDKIDSGSRFVYGVHSRHYFSEDRHFFLFLGQTKRLDHKTALPPSSGEDNHASDIVGTVDFKPLSFLQLQSRFLIDRKRSCLNVAESNLSLKGRYATVATSHVFYQPQYSTTRGRESLMTFQVTSSQYKNMSLSYNEVRDFNLKGSKESVLVRGITLSHANECLTTTLTVTRGRFKDRDIRPDTRFLFQLTFKNLGTVTPIGLAGFQMNGGINAQNIK